MAEISHLFIRLGRYRIPFYRIPEDGGVAERSKAAALKAAESKGSEGSNPSSSASLPVVPAINRAVPSDEK